MRTAILAIALGAALLPMAAQAQSKAADKQTRKPGAEAPAEAGVIYIPTGDPAMKAATAEARRTLPGFFEHFAKPGRGETDFTIKYDLLPEPDSAEYIWADVISHTPGVTIARIANVPVDPRFKQGEKVTIADADVVDWGYFKDGVMQGSFTTRAMLPRYNKAEAEQLRKGLGWTD